MLSLKRFRRLVSALTLSVTLFAANSASTATAADPVEWDLLVYLPLSTPAVQMLTDFTKEVEAETEGNLVITVRTAGELPYGVSEYHRAVGSGDVAMADSAFFTADIPAAGVLTSSFLVQDYDEMRIAMETIWDELNSQLARFGAEAIMWSAYAPIKMWGKGEPISGLDDISGMKVRALSAENAQLLESLDAVPVTLATPEVMTALEYGTVDAILTSPYGLESNKWIEAFDWGYMLNVAMTPTYLLVNQEMMEDLPQESRDVVRRVAADYQDRWVALAEEVEGSSLDEIESKGVELFEPTPAERKELLNLAKPIWAGWVESRGGNTGEIMQSVRETLGR